ncbi:MAG: hypothetical protein HQM14_02270 [SAR324 cluster bacterium]|nr:hypothetical protein [SAR324 cluster bacterium]
MRINRFTLIAMGLFIIVVGVVSVIWNTEEEKPSEYIFNDKGELSQQLEAFLDDDQVKLSNDKDRSVEAIVAEKQSKGEVASNEVYSSAQNSIQAVQSKKKTVQKQMSESVDQDNSVRKQSMDTSSTPPRESNDQVFDLADEDEFFAEEEITYEDAYKRSLYDDPYEREFVLNDENAEHGDLAAALTKLDVDHAIKNKDIKSLQRWLDIFTVVKYPATREQFKKSYKGTKAYLRKALKELKATN